MKSNRKSTNAAKRRAQMHKSGALQVDLLGEMSNLFINVVDRIITVQKSVLAIGTEYASGLDILESMFGSGSALPLGVRVKSAKRGTLVPLKARSTAEVGGRHGQMRSGSKAA